MFPSYIGSTRRSNTTIQYSSHILGLQRARISAFGRNLSAQSRNLAANVANLADGVPAKVKEMLARRSLDRGTTGFTNMEPPQQPLMESSIGEQCGTPDVLESSWVDCSGETLVETEPLSPATFDETFPLDKGRTPPIFGSSSPTAVSSPDTLNGTTTEFERTSMLGQAPPECDSPFIQSPFPPGRSTVVDANNPWCTSRAVPASPGAWAWDPSLSSTTPSDSQDDKILFEARPGREGFSLDLDPCSLMALEAKEGDMPEAKYARLGVQPHDRAFDPRPGEDPFQDPSLEVLVDLYQNPFVSPGADLESYLGSCYPGLDNDDAALCGPTSGSQPNDIGGDGLCHWYEPSMTLYAESLLPDETPYSIPDFFTVG